MARSSDIGPAMRHLSLGIDDDRRADHALDHLPVHVLLSPGSVDFHDFMVWIRKEPHRKAMLRNELLVALDTVRATANDRGLEALEVLDARRELASLGRAAGRVVSRIEVEH